MKKLLVLLTLLAAFASFGCGSDEPAADAPAKAPTATTKTETTITEKQSKTKTAADKEMEKMRSLDTGKGCHNPDAPGVAEMLISAFDVHADEK